MSDITPRRATRLDEVRTVRSIPQTTVPSIRAVGGVGWRPGVPHILLHAGDNVPVCPFPVGWEPVEYIQPVASRGLAVPVGFLRAAPDSMLPPGQHATGWELDEFGSPQPTFTDFTEDWYGYQRSGEVGLPWVAPANAATLPATVQALGALDIAVVSIDDAGVFGAGVGYPLNEMTYEQLLAIYSPLELITVPGPEWPDRYGGNTAIRWWGAAMACLTGAFCDFPTDLDQPGPTAMSYTWSGDSRWSEPTGLDAEEFVDFLLPRILSLAENLGSALQFDIACCIDSTGSFSGSNTTVNRIFRTIIERCRDEDRDIFVGVSAFEEYGRWSLFEGGENDEGRPFILEYPIASVHDDVDFANLLLALDDDPNGGGGDAFETQLEAMYQIATGAGFSGQNDGITTRSGVSGERGAPLEIIPHDGGEVFSEPYKSGLIAWYSVEFNVSLEEAEEVLFLTPDPRASQGVGYQFPGSSGDVPAFGRTPRGAATIAGQRTNIWSYPGSVE